MQKALVIQLSRIGDLLQSFPLLGRLKAALPALEITLVCLRDFQEVLEHQPLCDRVVPLELADVWRLGRAGEERAAWNSPPFSELPEFAEPYDLVVNLTHDEGSAVMCEMITSRQKSGRIRTVPNEIRLLGDWAKYLFAAVNHRALNLFNLVDIYIGMGGVRHQPTAHCLRVDAAAEREAMTLLLGSGFQARGKLVALQLGASERHRAWPVEKFAMLAERLREDRDIEIALLGDAKEVALGSQFAQFTGSPVLNLIGKTQIRQLPAVLKLCEVLVSNDTGTIHIAAAVSTHTVGLYFSTAYFAETAPYGAGHIVLQVETPTSSGESWRFSPDLRGADLLPIEAVLSATRVSLGSVENVRLNFPCLAVYRSSFLANGTLAYVPVEGAVVSSRYLASLLHRLTWEKALGLHSDESFATAVLSRLSNSIVAKKEVADLRQALSGLQPSLSRVAALARQIITELARPSPVLDRMKSLQDQLEGAVKAISGEDRDGGLFQDFLKFEVMDLDHLPPLALAAALERKFAKLERFAGAFLKTLASLEARLR